MLIEAHGPLWSKNKRRKVLSLLTSRTKLLLFSTSSFAAEVQEIHFQLWQGRCTHSCWGLQLVKNLRCERKGQCRHKRGWLMAQLLFTFISITHVLSAQCYRMGRICTNAGLSPSFLLKPFYSLPLKAFA